MEILNVLQIRAVATFTTTTHLEITMAHFASGMALSI
jgi:hypothetical protein